MNEEVVKSIRNIANNFATLADELEKNDTIINDRISTVECGIADTKQILADVAHMILGGLE